MWLIKWAAGQRLCFILIPFHARFKKTHIVLTKSLGSFGWKVLRADEVPHHRRIIDFVETILISDLVVADLTDSNPNVLYELGIAHAVGRDTLLISRHRKLSCRLIR